MIEDYIENQQDYGQQFTVSIFLKVQKVLTTILYTISKNFYIYVNDPFICLLSADDFKTMLKHKRF